MICRIWHGWTTEDNADAYEHLLRNEIVAGILLRKIPGFRAIEVFKRSVPDGIEFVTMMRFDSIEAVQRFAGPDYEMAVVPPAARQLLTRFNNRSAHYSVIERRDSGSGSPVGLGGGGYV